MNKKILSFSISLSITLSSSLGLAQAGGFVGDNRAVEMDIPSIHAQNFSLDPSALNSELADPQLQGVQELVEFQDGVNDIQAGGPLNAVVGESSGVQSATVASTNNKTVESVPAVSLSQSAIAFPAPHFKAYSVPKKSFLGNLSSAIKSKIGDLGGKIFDGTQSQGRVLPVGMGLAGFRPGLRPLPKLSFPRGVEINSSPILPDTRHLPESAIKVFSAFSDSKAQTLKNFEDVPLQANPQNSAAIERAVRDVIDQNPIYGVKSADLSTAYVHFVEGDVSQGLADTWYAVFRQQKASQNMDGTVSLIPVFGASPTFVIKIINGEPVVKAVMGRIYSDVSVDANQKISDAEMEARVKTRLKMKAGVNRKIALIDRQIIYVPEDYTVKSVFSKIKRSLLSRLGLAAKAPLGSWHAVNLYNVDGLNALVAVDIATGQTFLWDMRLGAAAPPAAPPVNKSASAQFEARVPLSDHDMTNPPNLSQTPLPNVTVRLPNGSEIVADEQGRVNVSLDKDSVDVVARLDGPYAVINNQAGEPLEVKASLVKGQDGTIVVFNPPSPLTGQSSAGVFNEIARHVKRAVSPSFRRQDNAVIQESQDAEKILAQVTAYYSHHVFINWAKAHGVGVKDGIMDQKLTINVNIADSCNAYYDPSSHTLNFFLSSAECINTGTLPGVSFHESGHWAHFLAAGYVRMGVHAIASVDGGLSEGIGDSFAMYILKTPLIGEHFFNDPQKPYLRTGENDYQFNSGDEVHDQGLAWMGFAWNLRTLLSQALGDVPGVSLAEKLLFPNLYGYALASDIPNAMNIVYLAAMKIDGSLLKPAEEAIRAAAAKHGVNLSAPSNGNSSSITQSPSA